jgi:Calcineurin-like phosphoesterase
MTLVGSLKPGPLDIVGDVHGEIGALESLLARLGYQTDGSHPHGRHLVFVGDLTDRGPDSPGVLRTVQALVEKGIAQLVAGNHELNLLRREQKHGNHWFFGTSTHKEFGESRAIADSEQESILTFLRGLPVALERENLRVVHAAWVDSAIEQCRRAQGTVDEVFERFETELRARPEFRLLEDAYEKEQSRLGGALQDSRQIPRAEAIGPYDEYWQMQNPIKVVTSGVERANQSPFFASGKWRFVDRVPWWKTYNSSIPVIFGHYWRWWNPAIHSQLSKGEPQLFSEDPIGPSMSAQERAFCVDFSVGSRFKQRLRQDVLPYHGRLAALRWPERELVFDDDGLPY